MRRFLAEQLTCFLQPTSEGAQDVQFLAVWSLRNRLSRLHNLAVSFVGQPQVMADDDSASDSGLWQELI
ncbi:hypothetical protein JKG47_09995 [Acidithiobacillus sp. MC6.1]|nr:hypothetical protein [Acidithiobacillus sp. MC6.1]